ncbi:MAG: universal stress protein [Bacteroidota bacterium]
MLNIRSILVPNDYSPQAQAALRHAAWYAKRHKATVHLLTVSTLFEDLYPVLADEERASKLHPFEDTLSEVSAKGNAFRFVEAERKADQIDKGILKYAEEINADLIVMATHGRQGLDHLLIGSVAESVVRRADCPVLTVRSSAKYAEPAPKRILVPLDFSAHARKALAHARELRDNRRAELNLLHIVQHMPAYGVIDVPPEPPDLAEKRENAALKGMREIAAEILDPNDDPTFHVLAVHGNPAIRILEAAKDLDADLIVMASHGRTGIRRFVLGSVAEKIVQLAPCPVFTVKAFGQSLLPGA